jgi:hypothetical protein
MSNSLVRGEHVDDALDFGPINCLIQASIAVASERDLLALTDGMVKADTVKQAKLPLDNQVEADLREHQAWECSQNLPDILRPRVSVFPSNNFFAAPPDVPTAAQEQGYRVRNNQDALRQLLLKELIKRLEVFRSASTLNDRYTAHDACALYGLGRLLFLIRIAELQQSVQNWGKVDFRGTFLGLPKECRE